VRNRFWAANVIDNDVHIALKFMERSLGLWTENPINSPGIEAERTEPKLELGDVLSTQHGRRETEESVTEAMFCFENRPPNGASAEPVRL
jgi:hypothetical protein